MTEKLLNTKADMEREAHLVTIVKIIHDTYLVGLPSWDFDFIMSMLSNMSYRRNKIEWDLKAKENNKKE